MKNRTTIGESENELGKRNLKNREEIFGERKNLRKWRVSGRDREGKQENLRNNSEREKLRREKSKRDKKNLETQRKLEGKEKGTKH